MKSYLKNNIKTLRLQRGLSQRKLAKYLGYNRAKTISELERGANPKISVLIKLSVLFKISIDELILTKL